MSGGIGLHSWLTVRSVKWTVMSRIYFPCIRVRNQYSTGEESVIIKSVGHVATIGINRPRKRNCIDEETAKKLFEAFLEFENNNAYKAAVLYGTGGNFCSGFDLQQLATWSSQEESESTRAPMGPTRMKFKKPVVAAVNGYAVAGGLELALMCDLRVVEETAVMGVFNRRFGVPLIDGGTVRLQALIGLSRALDLVLTGRAIKGKEALDWGLANRLVACGTGLGQGVNLATSLVKFPQESLLADRQSLYYSAFSAKDLEDALQYEKRSLNSAVQFEAITGAKKFMEGIGKHGKFNISEPGAAMDDDVTYKITDKV